MICASSCTARRQFSVTAMNPAHLGRADRLKIFRAILRQDREARLLLQAARRQRVGEPAGA